MDNVADIPQSDTSVGEREDIHPGAIEHPTLTTRLLILSNEKVVERLLVEYSRLPWAKEHLTIFKHHLFSPQSYFLEVLNGEAAVGLVYFTSVIPSFVANVNVVFWDRKFGKARRSLLRSVMRDVFNEFELSRIQAWVPVTNQRLQIELRKAGMKAEGLARSAWRDESGDCDAVLYGILRNECE